MTRTYIMIALFILISHLNFAQCDNTPSIDLVFSEEGAAYSLIEFSTSASDINDSLMICSVYQFKDTTIFKPFWNQLNSKKHWNKLDYKDGFYYAFIDLIDADGSKRLIVCSIYKYIEGMDPKLISSFEILYCQLNDNHHTSFNEKEYNIFRHYFIKP